MLWFLKKKLRLWLLYVIGAMTPIASLSLLALVSFGFFAPASAVVVAKDQRTSKIPAQYRPFISGVGILKVGRGQCTAFCIANNAIATSRHCLQQKNGRWRSGALNLDFLLEHQGKRYRSQLFGADKQSRKMNIAHGLGRYRTGYLRDISAVEVDWIFIKIKHKICQSVLPVKHLIGLASRTLPEREDAGMVSAERFNKRSRGKRWTYSGNCQFFEPNIALWEGAIIHNCDSVPGTSGSPIILKDDTGNHVVVAINSGSARFRDRRTDKWKKLNYASNAELFGDSVVHFVAHNRISDSSKIKELQTALKAWHFLKGNADGIFGPNTRLAIYRFEKSIGLPSLGLPSELIFDLLSGNREIPKSCLATHGKSIFPPECHTIGLPPK